MVDPTSMSTEVVTVNTEAGIGGLAVSVVRWGSGGAEGELELEKQPSSSSFRALASSSNCLEMHSS